MKRVVIDPAYGFRKGAGLFALIVVWLAVFVVLSGFAVSAGLWKLLVIGWVAFVAMAGFAAVGVRVPGGIRWLTWGYGLTSGAMVTSAAVFLVPLAVRFDPEIGGFGMATGIIAGFGAHVVGHQFSHLELPFDDAVLRLTAHTLAAGIVIGVVYSILPALGLLLGLGIVSHKGPAGYASACRLAREGKPVSVLIFPAAGVGVPAILLGLLQLSTPMVVSAAVFGFAAGIFLHVAMDFLPRCEVGSEVGGVAEEISDDAHALLDRLRVHAVASTFLGGIAVFTAWLLVSSV